MRSSPKPGAAPRASVGRGDPLSVPLALLAAAGSEAQVIEALRDIAITQFGATGATMLTCEPARRGGGTGAAVGLGDRIASGAPFVTAEPAADLPGLALPGNPAWAAALPCAGGGDAVCVVWGRGRAAPQAADLDRLGLLAGVAGLARERHAAARDASLLSASLDNRIRNVLAVIRSVGTRSAEQAASIDDFLLHFGGRIDAIGRSQLAAARFGDISFELLLREELLAQAIQDGATVSLEGMDVGLTAVQAEGLGLALHELAVNAVKFGAMAEPGGSLAVRWWVETQGDGLTLNVDWRERCPSVCPGPRARSGFGMSYLEQALPFQLDAEVALAIAPPGLCCQIAVPLHRHQVPGAALQVSPQRGYAPLAACNDRHRERAPLPETD